MLRQAGISVPPAFGFALKVADADAYWSAWLSRSRRGPFKIAINLNRRRRYDRGRPLLLFLHEVCGHLVQRAEWISRITTGEMDEAIGMTVVHAPEVVLSEGLGQTISEFLRPVCLSQGADLPTQLSLSKYLQLHEYLVVNNAQLMLFSGESFTTAFSYAMDLLPFSTADEVEAVIRDRSSDLLYRSYQMSYGVGQGLIMQAIKRMTLQQQNLLFMQLYCKPMTPKQFTEVATGILNNTSMSEQVGDCDVY